MKAITGSTGERKERKTERCSPLASPESLGRRRGTQEQRRRRQADASLDADTRPQVSLPPSLDSHASLVASVIFAVSCRRKAIVSHLSSVCSVYCCCYCTRTRLVSRRKGGCVIKQGIRLSTPLLRWFLLSLLARGSRELLLLLLLECHVTPAPSSLIFHGEEMQARDACGKKGVRERESGLPPHALTDVVQRKS